MRVLIVDDSVVFRSQIKAALSAVPGLEIVGSAANGKLALAQLKQSPIDLMTLDLEMPEMNGLETLKEIRRLGLKVRVIMFSSMTQRGGEAALEALRLGADDVVAKPSSGNVSLEGAAQSIAEQLVPRVKQFLVDQVSLSTDKVQKANYGKKELRSFTPSVIVIGASTGGPRAIEEIFADIRGPYRVPVLIVQHMPPVFTKCLADRISQATGVQADEAKHMEPLLKNRIYVAPGDFHMSLASSNGTIYLQLDQGPQQNMVRPAVDPLFETAAIHFRQNVMGFVLTGMGEDGLRGARAIKQAGGGMMIQNKESCVVFGMPGAIFRDGCFDQVANPQDIKSLLAKMLKENSL